MDAREVPIIGTINALLFKLVTYPEVELTMSVLMVDIPPHYGMLLSRKWSAAIGASLQCDLSYATFYISDKVVRVDGEPRVNKILGEGNDKDSTCFLDTSVNSFREKLIIQEVEKLTVVIEHGVLYRFTSFVDHVLWWG